MKQWASTNKIISNRLIGKYILLINYELNCKFICRIASRLLQITNQYLFSNLTLWFKKPNQQLIKSVAASSKLTLHLKKQRLTILGGNEKFLWQHLLKNFPLSPSSTKAPFSILEHWEKIFSTTQKKKRNKPVQKLGVEKQESSTSRLLFSNFIVQLPSGAFFCIIDCGGFRDDCYSWWEKKAP